MRKIIFWLHLTIGISAGLVVFTMSATGVLLMYEKQIIRWADRSYLAEAPTLGAPRLAAEKLVAAVPAKEGEAPTTLVLYSGSTAASVAAGRSTYYVDVHSGELLGQSSQGVRSFFRTVTDVHRYIAMSGDNRTIGKAITGAANLAFLFILLSGIVIWWRGGVLFFKKNLRGKARNWNWHHVFGIWAVVPLALVVLSGTVISYPWASNLVYKLTGSEVPAQGNGRGGNRNTGAPNLSGVDAAIQKVESAAPGWQTISLRMSAEKGPLSFTVDRAGAGQPQYRSTLSIDRKTGEIARVENFSDQNLGRRTRSWLRFVHTGEYYGIAGQTIAGIASFAGVMLVWTGYALSFHRLSAWIKRRKTGYDEGLRRDHGQQANEAGY